MSVIVKNMDMPSDCKYCPFYSYGYCKALGACVNTEHGIDTRCPLIEVKGEPQTKDKLQTFVADGIVFAKVDEPQTDCAWK